MEAIEVEYCDSLLENDSMIFLLLLDGFVVTLTNVLVSSGGLYGMGSVDLSKVICKSCQFDIVKVALLFSYS